MQYTSLGHCEKCYDGNMYYHRVSNIISCNRCKYFIDLTKVKGPEDHINKNEDKH